MVSKYRRIFIKKTVPIAYFTDTWRLLLEGNTDLPMKTPPVCSIPGNRCCWLKKMLTGPVCLRTRTVQKIFSKEQVEHILTLV